MQHTGEQEKVAHLLRRFGLGASEAELEYYGKSGYSGALDLLLKADAQDFIPDPQGFANKQGVVNIRVMQGLAYFHLFTTVNPLREKMTLFWHNHFATSAEKVDNSFAMRRHIETLREHSLGNFRDLLRSVSKDPAMIFWLDNQDNVAGKPNENFAREIMELFTLGVGNYSEKDIQEAARAFTGYSYGIQGRFRNQLSQRTPRGVDQFVFATDRHDNGTKTVMGKTGALVGDDIVDILCDNPQTSKYIAKKMWEWFAYEDPEPAVVERLAKAFRDASLDIKSLIRAIANSPEFTGSKATRKLVKTPIDFAVSIGRALGVGQIVTQIVKDGEANPVINEQTGLNTSLIRGLAPAFVTRSSTKSMGMELLYPPDVSGWRTGSYWLTTATMIERIKFADVLFAGTNAQPRPADNLVGNLGQGRGPMFGIQAFPLLAANPSPEGVVNSLLSLFDASVPEDTRKVLVEAAKKYSGGAVNRQNAGETARQVCRLIFGSPEFQMC